MAEQPKITENDIAARAAMVRAPESLHRRVQEMVAEAQAHPARRRRSWAMPGWAMPTRRLAVAATATALAAAALVVVLALALSGGGGPSVAPTPQATATLALGPATGRAPGKSVSNRGELAASVGGVAFPYWEERFGWRDSGTRSDTLAGRAVTTVFYSNPSGRRVGYAIVAGPAPAIASGTAVKRWGVIYRLSTHGGANMIAWRRDGHLCVIAGRGVNPHTLLALASWGSERAHAT